MRALRLNFFQKIHPSWCLYASFCGIIIGIVVGIASRNIFVPHWLSAIIAIFVILLALYFSYPIMIIVALLAGMTIGGFRTNPLLIGQENYTKLVGATVTLRGKVIDDPERDSSQIKLHLDQVELVENPVEMSGRIYVTLVGAKVEIERSDIITIRGELGEGFGIYRASMYRPTLEKLERAENGDIFARLKAWFAELVKGYIPSPEVDLGLGYLVGLKSGLPDDLSETLRIVGMTHVIVASGAHLGILVGVAKKFFGKISKFASLLFSSLLITTFVLIVGFTPSMTRAALVALLSLFAGYFGRKFTPLRLLIFVATATLLIEPTNFLNLGWQLSFASFFGIMFVGPTLQSFLYGGKKPPWLAGMLLTSFATSIICAPILIYNFGTISLLSFIANLFILPTLPYAMLLMFLTGATSFCPLVASLIGQITTMLLDFHIWIVNFLSEKTMFIFELTAGDYRYFCFYIPVFLILIWLGHCNRKRTRSP